MINISLARFLEELKLAQDFDRRYSHLNQTGWLLTQWSFDDAHAYYGKAPDIYAIAKAWLEILKKDKE